MPIRCLSADSSSSGTRNLVEPQGEFRRVLTPGDQRFAVALVLGAHASAPSSALR
jgi:hypothetical protein